MVFGHAWLPAVVAPSSVRAAPKAANAFPPELSGRANGCQLTATFALTQVTYFSNFTDRRTGHQAMMFPRKQRLTTQADFRFVFSGSKVSRDRYFRVLGRENGNELCRLGMAVSRKNCRKAVGRNHLKRLIRESFRQHSGQLAIGGGFDYVVLPTAEAATICNQTLARSLSRHWRLVQGGINSAAGTDDRKNLNG